MEPLIPANSPFTMLTSDVFCEHCDYELEPWEIHLLKSAACPNCGDSLHLGLSMRPQPDVQPVLC